MKRTLFPRLAVVGMFKNKQFYLPYFLSSVGIVTMYFIMHSLSVSPMITGMYHGGDVALVLSLGKFVIAVFSVLFLLYINSFTVKRRHKEFGLYNILGMTKKNIAVIVLWESIFLSLSSILCGVGFGLLFSKLAELGLLNMTENEVNYKLTFSSEAVIYTVLIYGVIFFLLTLKSLITVARTKPLELMNSESSGERPIKANWVLAVLGAVIVGLAYLMAVTIDNPLSALLLFFAAVIMVIIGTYLLFVSGSVALCKLLQKNRKYYYRKNHFISVSSMVYRMKRNGAGLASIAILSTMVLVMISTTGSLYFGKENALRTRYPRDTEVSVIFDSIDDLKGNKVSEIRDGYQKVFDAHSFTPKDLYEYSYSTVAGFISNDEISITPDMNTILIDYSKVRAMFFVTLDDYNKAMNTSYTLSDGEVMLHTQLCNYNKDSIKIGDTRLRIAQKLDSFLEIGEANSIVMPSFLMVIPNYDTIRFIDEMSDGNYKMLTVKYHYSYNSDLSDDETVQIYLEQTDSLQAVFKEGNGFGYSGGSIALERSDFYSTFGGFFFLGIVLSIVFIFAAAVIIYYKQISEGYEDRKRFEIMQNVGMTKRDIKSNINSQILTVFFAPLLTAGVHLGFAFPFLWKILQMFNLRNLPFVIMITAIAFVLFGLFYALIYKLTARAYYGIVSKSE